MSDEWVSVSEAAAITGLSRKALEGRIKRQTLPSEKRGGRLYVPTAELYRQRLVPEGRGDVHRYEIAELLDRLEMQAKRIGALESEIARLRGE